MNTCNGKNLTLIEKVIHVAFGCGCVRSFYAEKPDLIRCPEHGDFILSVKEEFRPKAA